MTTEKADDKSNRRDGPRIDLRLRVRYETLVGDGEAEASDVSPKGLRLESELAVPVGSELKLHVDAGEVEELEAVGHVTWCKPRTSPTGKTLYDLGVAFESDWLAKDRGPLGSALARIFAMNAYEPARNYERTPVALRANTASSPSVELEVGNLSQGGMQLRARQPLGDHVRHGLTVDIEIDAEGGVRALTGKIAWVAGQGAKATSGPRVADSFGIEFGTDLPADDRALLERIRTGRTDPARITVSIKS